MANMRTIEKTCIQCKQVKQVTAPESEFRAWESGQLIQRAMRSLSEGDCELLISSTCGPCFDKLFAEFDKDFAQPLDDDEPAF